MLLKLNDSKDSFERKIGKYRLEKGSNNKEWRAYSYSILKGDEKATSALHLAMNKAACDAKIDFLLEMVRL